MSWIAWNKPDLRTVRHMCSLLDTTCLDRDYLNHVKLVLKGEGYVVSLDSNNCDARSFNNTKCFNQTTIITTILQTNDRVNRNTVAGKVISFRRSSDDRISGDQEDINVEVNPNAAFNRKIFCEKGTVSRLYGRSVCGKQITFYTDIEAAVSADLVYDPRTLRVVLEKG